MSTQTILRTPLKKGESQSNLMQRAAIQNVDSQRAFLEQMYVISERWKSDLSFFYDEMNFLKNLVDNYLIGLNDKNDIEGKRKLTSDLSKLEQMRYSILQGLDRHRKRIVDLLENPFSHDAQDCKEEHSQLEVLYAGHAKDFRQTKRDVYLLTERIRLQETQRITITG